jgi:small GTP-binding protein
MKEIEANNFKSGLVTIVARPNVGKSTLLNKILGQKVAIATPLRQTTRKNLKGIYTDSNSQIVLIDTPGVHKPLNELGKYLYLDSGTLTPLLKKLEGKGLVTRKRSKEDERKTIIKITNKGLSLQDKAISVPSRVNDNVNLDGESTLDLFNNLTKLLESLNL